MEYIIALDQGTTSSRALLINHLGQMCDMCQKEYTQIYPQEGWVEQNPNDIWNIQLDVLKELISKNNLDSKQIKAIGIANQRETTIVWDRNTGEPIYNAIGWQCRRTSHICNELKRHGHEKMIQNKTGLVVDAYFSGTKIKWILESIDGAKEKAEAGDLVFGTVDTWLIWKLTGGKIHATDYTNASRTMLFNIHTLNWDNDMLRILDIPRIMLPEVKPSNSIFGTTDKEVLGFEIPIASVIGDQQSSLFGNMCLEKGDTKNTYGTGCFMLMNTGNKPVLSEHGLITTIAWSIGNKITYALEGSVFVTGSAIQWLRDDLKIINSAEETEQIAESVEDTAGAFFVPAFTGLGTPYWDMYARGAIVGLTRGVKREHIVRATLEAIAYLSNDIFSIMETDSKIKISQLKVDGGASKNNFIMQFQSDVLGKIVVRPTCIETTGMGTAFLAGLSVGFWKDLNEIKQLWEKDRLFIPKTSLSMRVSMMQRWKQAVERSLGWERL